MAVIQYTHAAMLHACSMLPVLCLPVALSHTRNREPRVQRSVAERTKGPTNAKSKQHAPAVHSPHRRRHSITSQILFTELTVRGRPGAVHPSDQARIVVGTEDVEALEGRVVSHVRS